MSMIRIAVCDDSREYIETMKSYLSKLNIPRFDYDVFFTGEELVASYQNRSAHYDVVLLDMEMNQINGIETANIIREFDDRVIIVFITNYSEYMKESFQCEPFRFLVKPLDYFDVQSVFHAINQKLSKKRTVVTFDQNKTKVRLYCEDIIVCESQAHWIWIHTKNEIFKVCQSLSEFHKLLDERIFVQVHKSFVINMQHIKLIKQGNISLYHFQSLVPISRSYKKSALTEYTNFIERNLSV